MPPEDNVPSDAALKLNRTALIVDDDESIRELLHFFLTDHFPDFKVEECDDGFQAIEKVAALRPELILLDLRIPGQDGLAVCSQIRKMPGFSKTVIIIISGAQDALVQESVMFLGANDFILKPYKADDLHSRIEAQLLAARQQPKAA